MLEVCGDDDAGLREVDAAHDAEDIRSIVRQHAARVDEIVGVAAEDARLRRRNGTDLCARGSRAARGLQPVRARERIGGQRLPAVGQTFLDHRDESVVCQRIIVRIGQEIAAIGRLVDQLVHGHRPAIFQHRGRLGVLAADVGPPDEIAAILANDRDRQRERRPTSRSMPIEYASVCGALTAASSNSS